MKKIFVMLALAAALLLSSCGAAQPAEQPQNEPATQLANPWREITEEEAAALCPKAFAAPEGAENLSWSVMESAPEGALVQLSFDLDGLSYTARAQRTDDRDADLSGMYYDWTVREDSMLRDRTGRWIPCRTFRYLSEDETADLCTWYDEKTGTACSLGVAAKDLDGFDLRAVADAMLLTDAPDLDEQRRILEENRALWAFDEGDYAPDWYYAFTDLDHNGLLEVLAASTQGSGVFTYVHFYEVLPDGSGVKNLYHADQEIEGPDDWPEIILDSIPCYYDRAADRWYYVCQNLVRDGNAHSVTILSALCLKDGVAEWETLAVMDHLWTATGEEFSFQDAAGKDISEADFENAAQRRFEGMEPSELRPDWTAVTR